MADRIEREEVDLEMITRDVKFPEDDDKMHVSLTVDWTEAKYRPKDEEREELKQ